MEKIELDDRNKCKHAKWHWKEFDCIVICDNCGAWHNASVSSMLCGGVQLHGNEGWHTN